MALALISEEGLSRNNNIFPMNIERFCQLENRSGGRYCGVQNDDQIKEILTHTAQHAREGGP